MFFGKIFKKKELVDDWISFSREKKEKKYFLKLNYAFSSFGTPKGYKYLLKISLFLDEELQKKYELIYEIEDKLSENLDKKFGIIFVGTKKTTKKYKIYFYAKKDEKAFSLFINNLMIQFPSVNFGISIEKDASWKQYFKNLLPSDFEYQKYENEKKFYSLNKKYLGKNVEIYYFLSYRNEKFLKYFKSDLQQLGFTLLSQGAGKRKNFPYAMKISKKQSFSLVNINNSVENLLNLVKKYSFKYEGWLIKEVLKNEKSK